MPQTNIIVLAPTASPGGEHDPVGPMMPGVAKLIVRRTVPVVLISETPPGLLVPFNAGMETKNVPVVGFHAGCSMPPVEIPPWSVGTGMGPAVRATGGPPLLVEKRLAYAGGSALLAAR